VASVAPVSSAIRALQAAERARVFAVKESSLRRRGLYIHAAAIYFL
jgi:hypothetical protein